VNPEPKDEGSYHQQYEADGSGGAQRRRPEPGEQAEGRSRLEDPDTSVAMPAKCSRSAVCTCDFAPSSLPAAAPPNTNTSSPDNTSVAICI
jgi:hypothetical protein